MPAVKKTSAKRATRSTKQIIGTRVKITLDETRGKETLILETPGQTIKLRNAPGSIELADGNGNALKIEPMGVTILAAAKVTIQAAQVKISAGAIVIDAAMTKCNGVLQCDTLVANSVISASYTPGAGNLM
jgi:hypothetical protein